MPYSLTLDHNRLPQKIVGEDNATITSSQKDIDSILNSVIT
jgi:hypothetical protein